jgi:hypothetical protein
MPEGHGLGGAVVAGINQGAAANQISTATAVGCMGEMGYLRKAKSEHLAICEAIKDQQQRVASAAPPQTGKKHPANAPREIEKKLWCINRAPLPARRRALKI